MAPGPRAALGFYLLLWAVILVVPFVAAPLKRFIADPQLFIGVASLLQAVLMVWVSLAFLKLKGFMILPTLNFKPTRFSLVLWGAVGVVPVGMISGLVLWPLIEAMPWLISKELEFLVRLSHFSDLPIYLFYALALSVGPAISEELAFRGVILQGLRSRLGASSAVVVAAVLFGTGRSVCDAITPARCAAPPAPAMKTSTPRPSADSIYSRSASGVRCALSTRTSQDTPNPSRVLTACSIVSQSDFDPITILTNGCCIARPLAL
jgi:membrane protease YdiL (CAAX protease family)